MMFELFDLNQCQMQSYANSERERKKNLEIKPMVLSFDDPGRFHLSLALWVQMEGGKVTWAAPMERAGLPGIFSLLHICPG